MVNRGMVRRMNSDVSVFYEATPNPQSMKFIATAMISPEAVQFASAAECGRSPLALKLFGFPWAAGVFIGPNFVTVTKQEWVDWDILAEPLAELIREHLVRGEPVLYAAEPTVVDETSLDETSDPLSLKIKKIIDAEIRPAVAMDGGDIVFRKFENDRVYLNMRGACAGCPSSSFTLKEGIETRLKQAIPEVTDVVAV